MIIASFILFTLLAAGLTLYITRKDEKSTSDGFFLGGRSLTFPIIAGSLLLTNLSTEQMVGLNGAAFAHGLSVMAWEVVAVVALVLMAIFFLPRFLKTGITTVPQFLELRYDRTTQSIANTIFLLAYTFILIPIILYSGAVGLISMIDLKSLTGIEDDTTLLRCTVVLIGVLGMLYSRFGGLRTLAVLDTINGIGLLVGGLLVCYFALNAAGDSNGIAAGWQSLKEGQPERLNSMGAPGSEVPFSTLFTGVALLNLFYWCTNQQIIQRTFGASSLAEGQKGVLLTGGLKLLGPLYLVLPGLVAYQLYAGTDMPNDQAYGTLVKDLLPKPLTGFFAAVMIGAILSSFNAALNSTSALFSIGLYKHMINPSGTEQQTVRAAKVFVVVVAIAAMIGAPFLAGQDTIFGYLQKMNAIYFIPIFSVVVVGMLHPRIPARAASIAMIAGILMISLGYFIPAFDKALTAANIHGFHFIGIVFGLLVAFLLVMGTIAPRATPWKIEANNDIDMTPWKGAKLTSALLVVIVIGIYAFFAN
ncbi:MAG: solute:sodium symporter family transporter [Akkermansiaceae bacterium]|jgi:solute:Na+ symporter, SSS family|nr:solute:sodium symporter family transporter [Akkermansiaceae bacterium]MDP4646196.1 solute:sodium symporter family transporter [Akkermansiaceae bacterium]MDP4720707.1 solute:sodium symporter family transporter [Akkermansiaceae bacterium]MDP4779110.1 solute:sodium symporter family transporter [Akkermansiaceae bacterium]MDP4847265.1 solute:sodium symporter family transporter [Akkermansiaceae bacterium]